MKNELLVRAMGEIDDELIEEAHMPNPKKQNIINIVSRYAAVAACVALIFCAAAALMRHDVDIAVNINGTELHVKELTEKTAEIPLVSTMQIRSFSGTEIPVRIDADGSKTTVTASVGSTVVTQDGTECDELVLSNNTEVIWCIDITQYDTFSLTVITQNKTLVLTAEVDIDRNAVVVGVNNEK